MKVKIKLFGDLREFCDDGELDLEFEERRVEVENFLSKIKKDMPRLADSLFADTGDLKDFYLILVNGRRVDNLNGLETEVEDGDRVAIFPPVAGG